MTDKINPRKTVATAVLAQLQGLPEGFTVLPNVGNPYAFTVIDASGRRFRVAVKETE